MRVKLRSPFRFRLLLILSVFSAITACNQGTQLVGTYMADVKNTPGRHANILELKEAGIGVWRIGDDEVPFSWYQKDGELRLNTRNGGIIVGRLDDQFIRITLPGQKEFLFEKVRQ